VVQKTLNLMSEMRNGSKNGLEMTNVIRHRQTSCDIPHCGTPHDFLARPDARVELLGNTHR
jgi:hypothetical protein